MEFRERYLLANPFPPNAGSLVGMEFREGGIMIDFSVATDTSSYRDLEASRYNYLESRDAVAF
jgi:hypothetical protein